MLNEKKIEYHINTMEAHAHFMLAEAEKIRSLFGIKKKTVKIDPVEFEFYKKRNRQLQKSKP